MNTLLEARMFFWHPAHAEITVCNLQFYLLLDGMFCWIKILARLPVTCSHFEKPGLQQNQVSKEP